MTALPWPPPSSEEANAAERTKMRLLELLKQNGPQTAQQLAALLEVTLPATRRHLTDLQAQGVIESQVEKPGGRGRPQYVFALTDRGEDLIFPKTYASLCTEILSHLADLYGQGAVIKVFDARNARLAERWRPQLAPSLPLPERLERLCKWLDEMGFSASMEQENGHWYLVERNCPSLQIARAFKELCQSELELYSSLLGVKLVRESCIACGQISCRYRLCLEEL